MDRPEQWALHHLDLVEATADWWSGAQGADEVPAQLAAAWRGVFVTCWSTQANAVLEDNDAVRWALRDCAVPLATSPPGH